MFLLISGELEKYFSGGVKKYVRKIDVVTVKGSIKPISLHTIDVDSEGLPISKDPTISYVDFTKKELRDYFKQKKLTI